MPKISALPAVTTVVAADLLPLVTSAGPTTNQITMDNFRISFFGDSGGGLTATPLTKVSTLTTTLGVGVGVAASTSRAINVTGTTVLTAGTSQYGAYIGPTMTSAATTAGYGIYIVPTTATAAFTQTNTYGIYIDTATIGVGSAITNQYGIYINTPTGASTINRALHIAGGGAKIAAGGLEVTAGNIGVGTAVSAYRGILISGTSLVSAANTSRGIECTPTHDSNTTSAAYGILTQIITAAAAFTVTNAYGLYVDTPSKGGGSAITTAYGIVVKAQTQGTTTNWGIYVEAASGGAGGLDASIGLSQGTFGVRITGTSVGAATTKYGFYNDASVDTGTSNSYRSFVAIGTVTGTMTSLYGFYSANTTSAAAFTLTNRYGVYVDNVTKGAGSTITNDYGLFIVAPSNGSTVNEAIRLAVGTSGIRITGASVSAATTKYGILLDTAFDSGTSVAAHGVNVAATAGATMTSLYGAYLAPTTTAAAFTLTNLYGLYVAGTASAPKGAGSTITNRYGVYVEAPTDGGTINYAIVTTGGTSVFGLTAAADHHATYNNGAALATTATVGFLTFSSCAGAPTGAVTPPTGSVAIVYDSTNNKIYVRSGGAWRATAALA